MASSVFDSLIADRGTDPLRVVSYKPDLGRDSKNRPVFVLYPVYANGERGQYAELKIRLDSPEPLLAFYKFLPELEKAVKALAAKANWTLPGTQPAPAPKAEPASKVDAAIADFPF